jgi:micrococcal nuclease
VRWGLPVVVFAIAVILGACAAPRLNPVADGAATTAAPTERIPTATSGATATNGAAATSVATSAPDPEANFGPTSQTVEARVVRVVDGDTIVVEFGGTSYKLRYIGMNTPETKDPNSPVQWMGPEATVANAALVEGKTVFLEKDVSEVDRYGRLLRYVWLSDGPTWTLVNVELVRQGFAALATYPPDVKYVALILAAEQSARAAAVGLWGTPPPSMAGPTPKPVANATPKPQPPSCHPSYSPCLPIVADLDCKDVRAMGKAPVTVKGSDPYRLDGDHDGIGCE